MANVLLARSRHLDFIICILIFRSLNYIVLSSHESINPRSFKGTKTLRCKKSYINGKIVRLLQAHKKRVNEVLALTHKAGSFMRSFNIERQLDAFYDVN